MNKTKNAKWLSVFLSLGGILAVSQEFKDYELHSLYYADLGPSTIDVVGYPRRQQQNYDLFKKTCSQCHTLARAINSPTTDREVWDYYVTMRMQRLSKIQLGGAYSKEDAGRILDFLAYDSHVRKIIGRKEFEKLTRDLQNRFAAIIQARTRQTREKSNK